MRVTVAGSSGLIGTALVASLRADGHEVRRLVRRPAAARDEFSWSPPDGEIDLRALADVDAVVNLCGAGIGDRRWSAHYKQVLRESRIDATGVVADGVARAGVPTLLNASAVGIYGDTGDRAVDESGALGIGFLADLCRDWELATESARTAGVRTVLLRSGTVVSPHGGLLGRLRPLFGLGLGGRLGSGRQYLSWISLEDELEAIKFALRTDTVDGPVNSTGPSPLTNAAFTADLGRALHRPTPWIVPGFAVRALVGEFADEAVLTGQRALPTVLEGAGFTFRHNTFGEALDAALAH
ncbi:TIGR01777 family protein [Rhodococcus spelaei]|uniref:TIGR01777 family protein n=1 Tax=Rhodococcus spelaei TaxID=2546320 RepID=A0A541BML4_9NOCA|nr:TIGR01777 family oxidoreductase [Rhodococcus spelaei]TQF73543.1 TIGR01777 family protein [Rhodococcus spelaei]